MIQKEGQSKSMTPTLPLFGPWCGWGAKGPGEACGVEQNPERRMAATWLSGKGLYHLL